MTTLTRNFKANSPAPLEITYRSLVSWESQRACLSRVRRKIISRFFRKVKMVQIIKYLAKIAMLESLLGTPTDTDSSKYLRHQKHREPYLAIKPNSKFIPIIDNSFCKMRQCRLLFRIWGRNLQTKNMTLPQTEMITTIRIQFRQNKILILEINIYSWAQMPRQLKLKKYIALRPNNQKMK